MAGEINGNGTNGRIPAPWWVSLIQTIGPTAAIAIFLVYVLAEQVNPALESIKSFMQEHNQQMQQVVDQIKTEQDTQAKQWGDLRAVTANEHADHEKAIAVAEQSCVNAAKSAFQTQKCMDARNMGEAAVDP